MIFTTVGLSLFFAWLGGVAYILLLYLLFPAILAMLLCYLARAPPWVFEPPGTPPISPSRLSRARSALSPNRMANRGRVAYGASTSTRPPPPRPMSGVYVGQPPPSNVSMQSVSVTSRSSSDQMELHETQRRPVEERDRGDLGI
jgi:hypothetical protein